MLGILCEKPSAARNFATALGGMSGVFEGTQYVIVASHGHIYEFDQPHEMVDANLKDTYRKWSLSTLPWDENDLSWSRSLKKDSADTKKSIAAALKNCDEIGIATDDDPTGEGNLIAWEILADIGVKPRKFSRFYFVDEAPKSIQKAFRERKEIISMDKDPDYLKAMYRSQWDFLSMQFTRIASCLTGEKLRQGRLKSAMVVIVGDQLKLISEYKKIPYYQWKFRDENGVVYTNQDEERFPSKDQITPNKYHASSVTVDSTEQKTQAPPRLPDLASISAALAPKGVKAKQVLDVYQKMYEDQVVSYPRTEDKTITPEQFSELLPHVDKIAKAVGVDSSLLTHRKPRPTHVKPQGAHGANRPGLRIPPSMEALGGKYGKIAVLIYEMLAKAYLAMLCEDYIYTQQKGHVTDYPDFKGTANCPVSLGYKAVYNDDDVSEEDEPEALLGKNAEPFIHEGFPPKPAAPTMKWLMKQLEKRSVGTGATRTSTYAEVTNAHSESALLKDTKGKIELTRAGSISYAILPGTNIGSLDITEQVYADMDAIAKGTATSASLLPKVRDLVKKDIEIMKSNLPRVSEAFPDLRINATPKEKTSGVYVPTGAEVSFSKSWGGHSFTDDEVRRLLNGETIEISATSKKDGKTYPVKGKLEEQTYKGKKFWGFSMIKEAQPLKEGYVEGLFIPKKTTVRFKGEFSGHVFTEDEIASLLNGDEIEFQATSKAGSAYTAKGKLEKQSYNGATFWGFKPDFGKKTKSSHNGHGYEQSSFGH